MKCFVHRDSDAVGTCCRCGRGLCPACIAVQGQRLACRGACHSALAIADLWLAKSRSFPARLYRVSAIALAILALLSLLGAAFDARDRALLLGLGAFFALLTALRIRQVKAWGPPRLPEAGPDLRAAPAPAERPAPPTGR